jgi:hypothetical protein
VGEDEVSCPEDCKPVEECDLRFGVRECDACIDQHCLTECDACASSADCRRLFDCYGTCRAEPTCIENCDDQFPDGVRLLMEFIGPAGCLSDRCSRDCS